jgi:N-succinyldiaminopimelate aminotransferase
MPNPFHQIYEGAALLAGGEPWFLPCPAERGFLPDFSQVPKDVWASCKLVYVCSPANPSGAVMSVADYAELLALADEHDFTVVSDECYSELYADELAPPCGLLEAAWALGRHDFSRCLVMHSLSKRSNAPGLRSGFIAGDAQLLRDDALHLVLHLVSHGDDSGGADGSARDGRGTDGGHRGVERRDGGEEGEDDD